MIWRPKRSEKARKKKWPPRRCWPRRGRPNHAAEGLAEAQVIAAKADAIERQGNAEAGVLSRLKFESEAAGIREKADAMKLFDGVGKRARGIQVAA